MSDTFTEPRDDEVRQRIEVRAYEIWEQQGRPDGCAVLHWCQAEQEITAGQDDPESAGGANEDEPPATRKAEAA